MGKLPGGGRPRLDSAGRRTGAGWRTRAGAWLEFREGACEEVGGAGAQSPGRGLAPMGLRSPGLPPGHRPRAPGVCRACPAPWAVVLRGAGSGEATAPGSAGCPAPRNLGARKAAPAAGRARGPAPLRPLRGRRHAPTSEGSAAGPPAASQPGAPPPSPGVCWPRACR